MHAFFVYPACTLLAWPAASLCARPFTFSAHAVDLFYHGNEARNRIAEVTASPYCLGAFVPGTFHRKWLIDHDVPADKIVINPQFIDLSAIEERAAYPRRRPRRIVSVARFIEKKGLSYLIEAAPSLKKLDAEIHLYGYGPLEEDYRKQIASLKIDNVYLHGPTASKAEYFQILSEADVVALPCVRAANGDMDGIPTVLLEAMALGVPVVASALSSIPDVIQDRHNGCLVEPASSQALSEAIGWLFEQKPQKLRSLGRQARVSVTKRLNDELIMHTLLGTWQKAIKFEPFHGVHEKALDHKQTIKHRVLAKLSRTLSMIRRRSNLQQGYQALLRRLGEQRYVVRALNTVTRLRAKHLRHFLRPADLPYMQTQLPPADLLAETSDNPLLSVIMPVFDRA
jgi:glycosyltransferase involved in cell wall biosynthesis